MGGGGGGERLEGGAHCSSVLLAGRKQPLPKGKTNLSPEQGNVSL